MIIDRNIQPPIRPTRKPDLVTPQKIFLDNGIPVFLLHAGIQDVCRIDFTFNAGAWQQHVPLQSAMTNAMLQEGCGSYSARQIAEIFDFHGAYLQLSADQHFGIISLVSLTKHLPRLMPLMECLVKKAFFPLNEFETLVKRRKQRFLLENEKVKVLCQKKFSEMLFGEDHPYSQTVIADDFEKLQLSALTDFYRECYHSTNCEILVAGRFGQELPGLLNRHFGGNDWESRKSVSADFSIGSSSRKLIHVNKPDAIQSAIRTGRILVTKDHPDYHPLQVLITVLGGYFSSRLMLNIREQKGFTYGVGSSFISLNKAGYLVIATEVDKKYEQVTLAEIFRELGKLRTECIGGEELNRVRQYLLGEFVRDLDGPFSLAQVFREVHEFGLDYSFYEKYYQTIMTVDPEQLRQLAETYFREEDFYTVIAGREEE